MYNGRINLADTRESASGSAAHLPGFGYRTTTSASEADDLIRGNMEATPLNRAYFSPANVTIVQNKIRREVYDRSKGQYLIGPQKADELLIVMRAMYFQYGRNEPTGIPEQIAELNTLVANWCVPKIIAECGMHEFYLRDIQTLPVPMEHPAYISQAGSRSCEFKTFF